MMAEEKYDKHRIKRIVPKNKMKLLKNLDFVGYRVCNLLKSIERSP